MNACNNLRETGIGACRSRGSEERQAARSEISALHGARIIGRSWRHRASVSRTIAGALAGPRASRRTEIDASAAYSYSLYLLAFITPYYT